MEQLKTLLNTDDEWAKQQAIIALGIVEAYSSGNITALEYQELLEDMIRSIKVSETASDLEIKTNVIKLISAASKLL